MMNDWGRPWHAVQFCPEFIWQDLGCWKLPMYHMLADFHEIIAGYALEEMENAD